PIWNKGPPLGGLPIRGRDEHELNHVHPNGKTRFHHGYQRGIFPSGSIGWMRVRRNRFSQCLTTAENFGSAISSKGFTRYSSSRDRVVERFPILRVYDFFQIIFSQGEP